MNVITIQTAKEEFLSQYPCKFFETGNVEIEVVDPDKIYARIERIFEKKGKDMYAVLTLKEQGGTESATTLIYQNEAYILIRNVPKITELYLSGAVYTELARIYVTYNCGVKRNEVFQFTFNEHCLIGYGFWIEYGTRFISYNLLSRRFPRIKSMCLDPKYIETNFARIPAVYMNHLTGYSSLADLYAVIMLKTGMGIPGSNLFPIDRTFIIGSRLYASCENILELLTEQSRKEEPFGITEKTLTRLGIGIRKFDDALADYRAALG